jgi:hypothetical protein
MKNVFFKFLLLSINLNLEEVGLSANTTCPTSSFKLEEQQQ